MKKENFDIFRMLHNGLIASCLFLLLSCQTTRLPGKKEWITDNIRSSITWKHQHAADLFNAPQYINVLDIDLKDKTISVQLAYSDSALITTSTFGHVNNAVAAVNGNFFHTEKGGSVCYTKVNNQLIDTTRYDLNGTLFLPWLDNGALAIGRGGDVYIVTKPLDGNWPGMDNYPTLITAGPLLLINGKILPQLRHSFNDTRYSRTGVGLTRNGHLLLVTVDGNTKESAGVTIPELALIFKWLGCREALNLDGGGSTTMWISSEPDNGIVNHPTDNKIFDHSGERKVANALLVMIKDKR